MGGGHLIYKKKLGGEINYGYDSGTSELRLWCKMVLLSSER